MGLVGLGILIIAAVYLIYLLFRFIIMFAATVPALIFWMFKKEKRQELASIEWDSDTILGFIVLAALAGFAIWLIFYLELPQAALKILEILFF